MPSAGRQMQAPGRSMWEDGSKGFSVLENSAYPLLTDEMNTTVSENVSLFFCHAHVCYDRADNQVILAPVGSQSVGRSIHHTNKERMEILLGMPMLCYCCYLGKSAAYFQTWAPATQTRQT